jgi:hypothetical protein
MVTYLAAAVNGRLGLPEGGGRKRRKSMRQSVVLVVIAATAAGAALTVAMANAASAGHTREVHLHVDNHGEVTTR